MDGILSHWFDEDERTISRKNFWQVKAGKAKVWKIKLMMADFHLAAFYAMKKTPNLILILKYYICIIMCSGIIDYFPFLNYYYCQ